MRLWLPFSSLPVIVLTCVLHGKGETVFELSPFEVAGSRLAVAAVNLGSFHSVPGVGSTEKPPFVDTWQALEQLPGLHVEQPGGLAGNAVLYLRGGEPNFTKVLIDGVEVNDPNSSRGGTFNFNAIDLAGIERMEVLGGTHSAVYGSDALSGVVRVQTMEWNFPEPGGAGSLFMEAGENGYWQAGAVLGLAGETARVKASANRLEESLDLTGEWFRASRFHGGAMLRAGTATRLWASAFGADIERAYFPDDSGGWLFSERDLLDHNDSRDRAAQITGARSFSDSLEWIAHLSWYEREETADSPGVLPGPRDPFGVPANRFINHLERRHFRGYARHRLNPHLALVYGASRLIEEGRSDSIVTYPFGEVAGRHAKKTGTSSAFVEGTIEILPGQRTAFALRWDDIDGLDAIRTGRVSHRIDLPSLRSAVEVAYGEGFKKPSFFALANPVVGNPTLRPEEAELFQLGWETRLPAHNLFLEGVLFRQEFTNLIDLSESALPRLINLQSVTSEGASFGLHFRGDRIQKARFHVTLLDLKLADTEELLRNRPELKIGFSALLRLTENLFLDVAGHYIGERQDSSIPTGTRTLSSFFRADAGLRWNLRPGVSATFSVENLFDEDYEVTVGNPGRERWMRGGLRLVF